MNIQIKLAIIAIAVVIPLSSIVVYGTDSNQQFTKTDSSKLQVISSFYTLHLQNMKMHHEKLQNHDYN